MLWHPQRTLAADTPFGSGSVDGPEVPGITGKASGTTKAIRSTKAPLQGSYAPLFETAPGRT
ncbi:hypothetical protein METUNv1_04008 [Methyloversatilis universalis FAM5]|uniref:Uncharacterized protein n=1 Tax=Methyloversatilis universalis (strain ATCC BAA-1314 / DSM 25237 / JCM 13912 / CCUG 52030 / FAM5) TaxID=1000565 RepID=F5RI58_METUF|nr:hypothetical protein METUNv1_04008 [Methyloversatilis universalis FAM5]